MITNRLRRSAALTETVNNKVINITNRNERSNNARLQRNNVKTTANRTHERVVATNGGF